MRYVKQISTGTIMLAILSGAGHALEKFGSRAISMARTLGPTMVIPTARSFSQKDLGGGMPHVLRPLTSSFSMDQNAFHGRFDGSRFYSTQPDDYSETVRLKSSAPQKFKIMTVEERGKAIELAEKSFIPTLMTLDQNPQLRDIPNRFGRIASDTVSLHEWIKELQDDGRDASRLGANRYYRDQVGDISYSWAKGIHALKRIKFQLDPNQLEALNRVDELIGDILAVMGISYSNHIDLPIPELTDKDSLESCYRVGNSHCRSIAAVLDKNLGLIAEDILEETFRIVTAEFVLTAAGRVPENGKKMVFKPDLFTTKKHFRSENSWKQRLQELSDNGVINIHFDQNSNPFAAISQEEAAKRDYSAARCDNVIKALKNINTLIRNRNLLLYGIRLDPRWPYMKKALGRTMAVPTARSFSSTPEKDNERFFQTLRDAKTAIPILPTENLEYFARELFGFASCLETYKRHHPRSIFWHRGNDESFSNLEFNWLMAREKCTSIKTEEEKQAIEKVTLLVTALWEDAYGPMPSNLKEFQELI